MKVKLVLSLFEEFPCLLSGLLDYHLDKQIVYYVNTVMELERWGILSAISSAQTIMNKFVHSDGQRLLSFYKIVT